VQIISINLPHEVYPQSKEIHTHIA